MDGFVIREADAGDREQIGLLWLYLMRDHRAMDPRFQIAGTDTEQYERHVGDTMRSKNGRVIVAQDVATSEVVAYILGEVQVRPTISVPGTYGFVSDLYVSQEWRRGGIGRALFDELKRWFLERGVLAIELYVSNSNPEATAFWKEIGLTPFLQLLHMDIV